MEAHTPPKPAPLTSLAPKLSIFTLRPTAHTEAPPRQAPKRPEKRRRLGIALFALLVPSVALALGLNHESPRRAPVPYINGAPQPKETQSGNRERWATPAVRIHVDDSVNALGTGALEAVHLAFGTWVASGAALPAMTFDTTSGTQLSLKPDGKNSVLLAPIDLPGHKSDLAITISFVDQTSGQIVEADVVLNAKKAYALLDGTPKSSAAQQDDEGEDSAEVPGCSGVYDVQNVVTHEAGHFFGLDEDRDDSGSTMYFKTGKCEIRKRDLSPPESVVMADLYQAPAGESADGGSGAQAGGCRLPQAPVSGGARSALLVLGLVAVAHGRRRRRH